MKKIFAFLSLDTLTLTAVLLVSFHLNLYAVNTGNSEGYTDDFEVRKSIFLNGGMVVTGNTIFVAPDTDSSSSTNSNTCDTYNNGSYINDASKRNNYYFMCHYNIDGIDASSAELDIKDPENSTIKWAGLYWQSQIESSKLSQISDGMTISMRHESNSTYVTVDSEMVRWADAGYENSDDKSMRSYSAFANVTKQLQDNNWKDGDYTVHGIPSYEGKVKGLGNYGAWTLVVIYQNSAETLKSFNVFDGWKVVKNTTGFKSVPIKISGFYTPKDGDISSSVSIFTAEGDKQISGDTLKVENLKDGGVVDVNYLSSGGTFRSLVQGVSQREPNPVNNNGIDIQTIDMGHTGQDVLINKQTELTFTFTTTGDVYWPSMIAFETEIYTPQLCYDYSYSQGGIVFTEDNNGSYDPRINGRVFENEPIDVSVYIRNQEDSDVIAEHVTVNFDSFNTSQATYINGSTSITQPNSIFPIPVAEEDMNSTISYANNIPIGTTGGLDYFYTYIQLEPSVEDINIPLNVRIDYNLTLPVDSGDPVIIPYQVYLNQGIPLCTSGGIEFQPEYGIFNLAHAYTFLNNSQVYNIPTQVVNKVDNFILTAYNPKAVHTEAKVNTVVSVELIGIDGYQSSKVACNDPTSSISPRIWMVMDQNLSRANFNRLAINKAIAEGSISDQIINGGGSAITNASDFFSVAQKSAAFRISYNLADNNGSLIKLENAYDKDENFVGYNVLNFTELIKVNDGKCLIDMDGNLNNQDTIPNYCNNAGKGVGAVMSSAELAVCMECVYGYNVRYDCSRDNFSIRPEAFKILIYDNNESTDASKTKLAISSVGTIAAGYNYRYDINATTHTDDSPSKGYSVNFEKNISTGRPNREQNLTFYWNPLSSKIVSGCDDYGDSRDKYPTARLRNGATINSQNKSDNIGRYELKMRDIKWTEVDQYSYHHQQDHYLNSPDCLVGSNDVPDNTSTLTRNNIGCTISSKHTRSYTPYQYNGSATETAGVTITTSYTDYDITVRPYSFDISKMAFIKGVMFTDPTLDTNVTLNNAFIYQNNIENLVSDDLNMSLHYKGRLKIIGKDGNLLTNFVQNCYSEDLYLNVQTSPLNLPNYPAYSYRLRQMDENLSEQTNVAGNNTNSGTPNSIDILDKIILNASDFQPVFNNQAGQAELELSVNFSRLVNVAMNPITINYVDFTIPCVTPGDCTSSADLKTISPDGNMDTLNVGITHLYARAHTPRQRSATPNIQVPINYEFYCDPSAAALPAACNINTYTNLPTIANAISPFRLLSPDSVRWYIQNLHNTAVDGRATVVRTRGGLQDGNFLPDTAVNMDVNTSATGANFLYNANAGFPYKATIEVFTPDHLLYNRYDGSATINSIPAGTNVNTFELEFMQQGNLTGRNNSNSIMDQSIDVNTNRRIQW